MLTASLKHFWQAFAREYGEARSLRMLVNSASAASVVLTFVALFVNLRIPVRPTWLPWLLWIAVGLSFLFLLLLAFIANYRYHIRIVGELTGKHLTASDEWAAEKRTLKRQAEQNRREAASERSQKEAVEQRATRSESDLYKLRDELEKSNLEHQGEKRGLQDHIEKLYRNYKEKHLSQMKEISDLKGQVLAVRSRNADLVEQIAGKNKTTFEVSTEIRESTVCLTDSGDVEDWRDATAFCLEAKLFIRYCNEAPEAIRIHGLRLSIVNDVTATEYPLNSYLNRPTFQPPNAQDNHYFLGFMLGGDELTEHYFHFFCLDVPTECALSVDKNSFLRVTLDAGNQMPYAVDLDVPWSAARKGYPKVSIRPQKQPK